MVLEEGSKQSKQAAYNIMANQSWQEILAQLPGRTKAAASTRFSLHKARYVKAAKMQSQQLSPVKENVEESDGSDAEEGNGASHEKKKKSPKKSMKSKKA